MISGKDLAGVVVGYGGVGDITCIVFGSV